MLRASASGSEAHSNVNDYVWLSPLFFLNISESASRPGHFSERYMIFI